MADNQGRGGNRESDTSGRGFASMDDEKQREIARKGGDSSADQRRDDQGQFTGSQGRGASSGGSSGSSGSGEKSSGASGASSGRGFAGMDDEKQREIASKGGQASGQSRSGTNR